MHYLTQYCSSDKSRRMRGTRHVVRMRERGGAYRGFGGEPEVRRPLGRSRLKWEDNIKKYLQEVGWLEGMDWIDLSQDMDRWRSIVKAVIKCEDILD